MELKLKFKGEQRGNGEDLYYSPETRKVYVRQCANVDTIVFWCSTSKWSGGYEASCPLKEGLVIIADYNGTEFMETLVRDDWNGGTSALKQFPFSWEGVKVKTAQSKEKLKKLFSENPEVKQVFKETLDGMRSDENIEKMSKEIGKSIRKLLEIKKGLDKK
jgi:hypothetical protein